MSALRADTGWAAAVPRRRAGGIDALPNLDHCAHGNNGPPAPRAPVEGLLRDFEVTDPDTGPHHRLRVAYIWSTEEAASVAAARERALATAEAGLTRIRNGLGGRYYKTRKQVDDRVANSSAPASPT